MQVAEELETTVSNKELAGMIQEFDSNADGRVTEEDFLKMMSLLEDP